MLEVLEDHLVAVPLALGDGVRVVPVAQLLLEPGLEVRRVRAGRVAAVPRRVVRNRHVEIGARELALLHDGQTTIESATAPCTDQALQTRWTNNLRKANRVDPIASDSKRHGDSRPGVIDWPILAPFELV